MEDIFISKLTSNVQFGLDKPNYFSLILLIEGEVDIELDLKSNQYRSSDILMVLPDTKINIQTAESTVAYVLIFNVDALQMEGEKFPLDVFRLFVSHYDDPKNTVSSNVFNNILDLTAMMYKEFVSEKVSFDILSSLLKIIFILLIRERELAATVPNKNIERIHNFLKLVHDYSFEEKRVSFYADKLTISNKRLNQVLQSLTNKSASYFIQEHLILEAKKRLIVGKFTVNEIAYKLGFEDRAYFSRFFKKWVGISPEKYKSVYLSNQSQRLYKDGLINMKNDY